MFRFLPPKRDSRWFLVGAALGLFCFIVYFLGYTRLLGADPAGMSIPVVMLFFILLAEFYALLGFYGLNWSFCFASAGLVAGLIAMLSVFAGDRNGWGDLIGFLLMLQLFALGLVLGLLVELVLYILKRIKTLNN